MSQQHQVEPSADIRAFLPRPGEAVDAYADRLRCLHRDLSLVLQAVERGLSAEEDEPPAPPTPLSAADLPETPVSPPDSPVSPSFASDEDLSAADEPDAVVAVVVPPAPRRAPAPLPAPGTARVEVISSPREPMPDFDRREAPRPLEERRPPPEPAHAEISPPAPASASPAAFTLPPLVAGAIVVGWLTIVALLVALLAAS